MYLVYLSNLCIFLQYDNLCQYSICDNVNRSRSFDRNICKSLYIFTHALSLFTIGLEIITLNPHLYYCIRNENQSLTRLRHVRFLDCTINLPMWQPIVNGLKIVEVFPKLNSTHAIATISVCVCKEQADFNVCRYITRKVSR